MERKWSFGGIAAAVAFAKGMLLGRRKQLQQVLVEEQRSKVVKPVIVVNLLILLRLSCCVNSSRFPTMERSQFTSTRQNYYTPLYIVSAM